MRLLCLIITILCNCQSLAHTEGTSFIEIKINNQEMILEWQIEQQDLTEKDTLLFEKYSSRSTLLATTLANKYLVINNSSDCQWKVLSSSIEYEEGDAASGGLLSTKLATDCAWQSMTIEYSLPFTSNPLHTALYTIETSQGQFTGLLNSAQQQLTLGPNNEDAMLSFLKMGIKHVLIGLDHLLFLVLMIYPLFIYFNARFKKPFYKKAVLYVTCFTIAHSITLALAWLNIIPTHGPAIEFLIAATIFWSAIRLLTNVQPMRLGMVFAFGLIHGVGFANSIQGKSTDIAEQIGLLFSFNIGVESGQLLFLSAFIVMLYFTRRLNLAKMQLFIGVSTACIGAFWLIERSIGFYLIS